jgi:hypothetical protein
MTDAANAWIVGNSGVILKYTEPGNVPVELNNFTAAVNGNDVNLNWLTATELNNSGFQVERKNVATDFWKTISFVPGRGTTTDISSYSYTDNDLSPGNYNYRLKQIDLDGSFKYYSLIETVEITSPVGYGLAQNFPNPFNPSTIISFTLPAWSDISLKVYDILGNEVKILVNEQKDEGSYKVEFNADEYPTGVYFYQIKANDLSTGKSFIQVKKMLLLK